MIIVNPTVIDALQKEQYSLVESVCEILTKQNHPNPRRWTGVLEGHIFNHKDEVCYQRFFINRAFRLLLGKIPEDNTKGRQSLFDDGEIEHWLKHFEKNVAPLVTKYQLPNT